LTKVTLALSPGLKFIICGFGESPVHPLGTISVTVYGPELTLLKVIHPVPLMVVIENPVIPLIAG
jgi:hypothetical protein